MIREVIILYKKHSNCLAWPLYKQQYMRAHRFVPEHMRPPSENLAGYAPHHMGPSWNPHCPKNNLNLGIETEPVTDGVDPTVYAWSLFTCYLQYKRLAHIKHIPLHASSRDRLGFCADIK